MARLTLALAVLAVALGGTALVLQLTERDVGKRIFFTHNASYKDEVDAKEIRAECPRGSKLIGGGHCRPVPPASLSTRASRSAAAGRSRGTRPTPRTTRASHGPSRRSPCACEAIAVCLRD